MIQTKFPCGIKLWSCKSIKTKSERLFSPSYVAYIQLTTSTFTQSTNFNTPPNSSKFQRDIQTFNTRCSKRSFSRFLTHLRTAWSNSRSNILIIWVVFVHAVDDAVKPVAGATPWLARILGDTAGKFWKVARSAALFYGLDIMVGSLVFDDTCVETVMWPRCL